MIRRWWDAHSGAGQPRPRAPTLAHWSPLPPPARTSVRKVPCERPLGSTERHRVHPGVQAFQPVVHAVPRVGRTPSLRKFSVGTRLVRGLNWRAWAFHPIWAQAAACAICRQLKLSENPIARAMLFLSWEGARSRKVLKPFSQPKLSDARGATAYIIIIIIIIINVGFASRHRTMSAGRPSLPGRAGRGTRQPDPWPPMSGWRCFGTASPGPRTGPRPRWRSRTGCTSGAGAARAGPACR